MIQRTLVLASRSPRRARLLREAGFRFIQLTPPFDDPPHPSGQDPAELAGELAREKARSVFNSNLLQDMSDPVVLGADTIVIAPDGQWLGQPADQDQARGMLSALCGKTHQVVTGVALCCSESDRDEIFADVAQVTLGPLEQPVLERYLASGRWHGKAGAYNLGELQGDWPFTVCGDPTTVVGLPMTRLVACLRRWSIQPAGSLSQVENE